MKNRKSLKYLLAPILCAALITAGMGLPVPAQSLEAEETADQTVEAEESAGQAAEEEGTEDQAEEAEAGEAAGQAVEAETAGGAAGAADLITEDGAEADDPGDMYEDAFSTEEDSSQAGMEAEDGSVSPDEDDGPQAAEASATESPEDGIEEDSDSTETSDASDASRAAPAEGNGEEIETDTESEEGSSVTDSSGAAETPSDDSSSERPAGAAAAPDPVSAGLLAPAKLTYTGQAQELVVLSAQAEGSADAPYEKILYSLDGENYGKAIPAGTDAGEYTVLYRLMSADGLTALHAGSMTVTIEKADVIFTPPTANTTEGA